MSRPSLNTSEALICAVDLGGTNLRAALVDAEGRIHERIKKPTDPSASAEETVSAIVDAVRECEARWADNTILVISVAVVVPGTVRVETGEVINAPNLKSLQGYRLASALEDQLRHSVLVENDANAAALGEMWRGAARDCLTMICLTLGTGVGSGIILDGELWRGVDGTAGEIGHTSVEPFGGVKCKCGNVGCLEVYASATAIVRMTCEALASNPRSSLLSVSANELTSERISRAAEEGDEVALDVFRKMGVHLGVAMANVINIFNPEMIVIGGGVSAAWDLFAEHAREEIMRRAFPVPAKRCRIARAECGDDAGLLGAAHLAFVNDDALKATHN